MIVHGLLRFSTDTLEYSGYEGDAANVSRRQCRRVHATRALGNDQCIFFFFLSLVHVLSDLWVHFVPNSSLFLLIMAGSCLISP